MTITEVYEKYKIMPQLQEHMLRVAGVASIIIDNLSLQVRGKEVITACLLHDMGNIIKFDLSKTKSLINGSLDLEYWGKIRQEFIVKYGTDEHLAHEAIAREIGVSERVMELIGCISFLGASKNAAGEDFGKKICHYSDDRVGPFGVISLEERFEDLRKRYKHHGEVSPERDAFQSALLEIEKQIFEHCKIKPADITENSVAPYIEKLRNWEI